MLNVALKGIIISVALLAEGVDRNHFEGDIHSGQHESPSSRRAWIEIRAV